MSLMLNCPVDLLPFTKSCAELLYAIDHWCSSILLP